MFESTIYNSLHQFRPQEEVSEPRAMHTSIMSSVKSHNCPSYNVSLSSTASNSNCDVSIIPWSFFLLRGPVLLATCFFFIFVVQSESFIFGCHFFFQSSFCVTHHSLHCIIIIITLWDVETRCVFLLLVLPDSTPCTFFVTLRPLP